MGYGGWARGGNNWDGGRLRGYFGGTTLTRSDHFVSHTRLLKQVSCQSVEVLVFNGLTIGKDIRAFHFSNLGRDVGSNRVDGVQNGISIPSLTVGVRQT